MRLTKQRNLYYIEIDRDKRYSLKTKDKSEASKLFILIKTELTLLNTYKIIVKEQEKILSEIENRHTRIMTLLNKSNDLVNDNKKEKRRDLFATEIELQNYVISRLPEMGITKIEMFKSFENGISDALGTTKDGKKIIFEFKLGSIREEYLGQCLRYLKNKTIKTDELWLIAEYADEVRKSIYADFPQIRLFVLPKNRRSKNVIREIFA